MRRSLRAQLTRTIALIVLITLALISLLSNVLIRNAFEKYARKQQEIRSEDIVANLSRQYDTSTGQWNTDYVHGVGMYALYEGYVIRLSDQSGIVVWDAEDHDMALCQQIMEDISVRMAKMRPALNGQFVSRDFDLIQSSQTIGTLTITYYGPYFLSENDFQFLSALNLVFIVIGSLSLLGALIAGGFWAKRLARPIAKAAHIAKEIAEGSYNIRFEDESNTRELADLIAAVNHMADSLNRQENLRKQLTTDVAHELRTPLTTIAFQLESMIEGIWEATPERLKSCYDEISRISGLVSDMESLARLEGDRLKLDKTVVDLLELVRSVRANYEMESAKRNITLEVRGETSLVPADRNRISQVIVNVLSNAFKYTADHGHICITVQDTPENGQITIEDNGIGIPKDELPLIFERFYRTDKSRNRKTGGAGIGLTIAKTLVTAHGGNITAESELDQGSRFTISLPKDTAQ
jgi:two-component system, OmpR family, sensor histidine kinase BaeS